MLDRSHVIEFMLWLEDRQALGFTRDEIIRISSDYVVESPTSYAPISPHDYTLVKNMDGSIVYCQCSCGIAFRNEKDAETHTKTGRY